MADDFDDEAGKPSERGANPAALDAAMAGANSDEAREFLRRQSQAYPRSPTAPQAASTTSPVRTTNWSVDTAGPFTQ